MFKTTSYIELNQQALIENVKFLKELIGRDIKFSSVVKGNAYGHGIEQFIPMAEAAGIDHFSVYSGDEAYRVFKASSDQPEIMIMGWMDPEAMEWAIKNGIGFWIFETERLDKALEIAKKLRCKAKIHIEVETGMNRTGLSNTSLNYVTKKIIENPDYFILDGLCTHYAGAESVANYVRVNRQISRFNKISKKFQTLGLKPTYRHTACSAAALNYPKTRMDLVRIGIAQYGLWPSAETFIQYIHGKVARFDPLNRIISWKSEIISIKKVKEGEFISYGTTYLAQEEKLIAVIPVGYSHGFSRMLSNQGRVLIHGQRVGVIGMVNMNMIIADITSIPDVNIGDEVVIVGKQGELEISISSFSEISNLVNYELLARLPERTNRIVIHQKY
ncbi:MAG: alanine racemase [Marinilabiliales bacterium]|jgi:alanine racemase|nr:MAG: alanine racemase [Marinilabiliales bacterium]